MKKSLRSFETFGGFLVLSLAMLVACGSAKADTYSFSYFGVGDPATVWGHGFLTTGANLGNGYFAITGITGDTSNGMITGLDVSGGAVATPPNYNYCCGFDYDNAFAPVNGTFGTHFDYYGVLFETNSGASPINIYGDGQNDGYTQMYSYNGPQQQIQFVSSTTSSSATPEPGLYGILALGLSGFAIAYSRRKRAMTTPTA